MTAVVFYAACLLALAVVMIGRAEAAGAPLLIAILAAFADELRDR
jgi:hypothetical protein